MAEEQGEEPHQLEEDPELHSHFQHLLQNLPMDTSRLPREGHVSHSGFSASYLFIYLFLSFFLSLLSINLSF